MKDIRINFVIWLTTNQLKSEDIEKKLEKVLGKKNGYFVDCLCLDTFFIVFYNYQDFLLAEKVINKLGDVRFFTYIFNDLDFKNEKTGEKNEKKWNKFYHFLLKEKFDVRDKDYQQMIINNCDLKTLKKLKKEIGEWKWE